MNMFTGMDLPTFEKTFNTEEACRKYLHDLKWNDGFICRKCGCNATVKGTTPYHKRCKNCSYNESPQAHTEFKNLKTPLRKLFAMAFHISLNKKGISCVALASYFKIRTKTAWAFKGKIQQTLLDHLQQVSPGEGVPVKRTLDGINLSFRGDELNGFQQVNLLLRYLSNGTFALAAGECCILLSPEALTESDLFKGHYIGEGKDLKIWRLKGWITGTHHHCSFHYLARYVAEYLYRYNHRNNRKHLWHNVICLLVAPNPYQKRVCEL